MRSFAILLIVGGLLAITATFSVGGPRLLTDDVASTIRGADEIPNSSCQVSTTDCHLWNWAHNIIENFDCAVAGECQTCSKGNHPLMACQFVAGKSCDRQPDGTDCGEKREGMCEGGVCTDQMVIGDCDDGHDCEDLT
jgi:hypothetical protein